MANDRELSGAKACLAVGLLLVSALVVHCGKKKEEAPEIPAAMSYRATISELNDNLTAGQVQGTVDISRVGDSLTLGAAVRGLVPEKMYLMHLHGFTDTVDAGCASAEQDTNGDGIVDLIETRAVSGKTLIPFTQDPLSLAIQDTTYPRASEEGTLEYTRTVSYDALAQAVKQKYGIEEFAPDRMVVYVHGADSAAMVPETVQSLPEVPAAATVPIGCGEVHVGG